MSQTVVTDVLFDELLKNQEDLKLFLAMHKDFPVFYADLCVEFFHKCLVPRLQREIDKYNNEHSHKLELDWGATQERQILNRWGGLSIVSKTVWPEKLYLFLQSDPGGCRNFQAGVSLNDGEGDLGSMSMPFEREFGKRFSTPLLPYRKGIKYTFCDYPSRDWNSPEMSLALIKDVLACRDNTEAPCPTAGRYVETLMALIAITDIAVKETAAKG